jgi:hypothetical protein
LQLTEKKLTRFLAYETMTVAQAKKYVLKPKTGNGASPLYRPVADTRQPKRPRIAEVEDGPGSSVHLPPPSTGTDLTLQLCIVVWVPVVTRKIALGKKSAEKPPSAQHFSGNSKVTKYSTGESSLLYSHLMDSALVQAPGVDPALRRDMCKLIHASLAASTWARYESGWRAFLAYESHVGHPASWPLSKETIRSFVTYCITVKKLKPTSTKTYLSAIVHVHKMKGFVGYEIADSVVSSLLRGAENLLMANPPARGPGRRVMTLQLLKILGHRLRSSGWSPATQQTVWAACTVAFFTSARMGELLAPAEGHFDRTATLTWACVQYRPDDSYLLHVRLPKSCQKEGEFLDVFRFPGHGCCPVAALRRHAELRRQAGGGGLAEPVFTFSTGKYLTLEGLNRILRQLLDGVVDWSRDSITCHSFRAGVPSALTRFPALMSSDDVKGWGRWSSESYQRYTRLRVDQKRSIFEKIMRVLS